MYLWEHVKAKQRREKEFQECLTARSRATAGKKKKREDLKKKKSLILYVLISRFIVRSLNII